MERYNLQFWVIGDPNSGKIHFIERFLGYFKVKADIHRKTGVLSVIHILNKKVTIWLQDVKDISIAEKLDSDVHGIFFCCSLNHLESFVNLEKLWIPPLLTKTQHCFLVVDESDLHSQGDNLKEENCGKVSETEIKRLEASYKLRRITKKEKLDNIMDIFLVESFLEKCCSRKRSTSDPSHGEVLAEIQSSQIRRRPIKPYVKPGKRRSIE